VIAIDTSAVVAVLLNEPDAERIERALAEAGGGWMSAASYLEACLVLKARKGESGVHHLRLLLSEANIEVVPVDRFQVDVAYRAWEAFGRGSHRAGLNFGDLFSYALAKTRGSPLLFVGEDFVHTDVQSA
jgi:ribonuclease VapC